MHVMVLRTMIRFNSTNLMIQKKGAKSMSWFYEIQKMMMGFHGPAETSDKHVIVYVV